MLPLTRGCESTMLIACPTAMCFTRRSILREKRRNRVCSVLHPVPVGEDRGEGEFRNPKLPSPVPSPTGRGFKSLVRGRNFLTLSLPLAGSPLTSISNPTFH